MARWVGESPITIVSRRTGTAAVADGMGCGADTSVGLAGLSVHRYDLNTPLFLIYTHHYNFNRNSLVLLSTPHLLHPLQGPPL